ncbi:ADP-ribosylhydrolase ARH3-like [Condylostylus longicornis]|uniref:ADP-ribosylhydrolase ARH3-like n=1 Tax=Condylostylus longicornis TaxID=2530218 RepID=UPI00244DD479|nr:ADP-ribosylhydrolase ARH3-like [Condylostylus longicornis]
MNKILGSATLLSKFRGCLQGGLMGDCCGAPYEGEKLDKPQKYQLQKSLDELEAKSVKVLKPYTDDTALSIALATCLIKNGKLPHKELAKQFCKSYFSNTNRGFGGGIPKVFIKLRSSKFEDPLLPAKEQFSGHGSYGNGAAMRVAPAALFCFNQPVENLIKLVKDSAVITHTHYLAINGAILLALAINYCLKIKPDEFNEQNFLTYLKYEMQKIENEGIDMDDPSDEYVKQILKIEELLKREPSDEMVINKLGNSAEALFSVPTAIYCFLRAQNTIKKIETKNVIRRTIEYAIHLGGDTDTIASMAGSLVGSLYGEEFISKNIISYCEASEEISKIASQLYENWVKLNT